MGHRGLEGKHVIIRLLDRVNGDAAVQDGGSDADVITTELTDLEVPPPVAISEPPATSAQAIVPAQTARDVQGTTPAQLELSVRTGANGYQVVSVTGELDIVTADQAYSYITEVIDGRPAAVAVDLSGVTFCDASGLGALARLARHARAAGRQFMLTSARPSVLKIIRITGLDLAFPELHPPLHTCSALTADRAGQPHGQARD
jgi:anti-sigma B factor antagonist